MRQSAKSTRQKASPISSSKLTDDCSSSVFEQTSRTIDLVKQTMRQVGIYQQTKQK